MNYRLFNIISILVILLWIWADKYLDAGRPAYGWLLLIYVSVLFCGSYFLRWGFFMKSVCHVETDEKILALTFDDGPAGEITPGILDILRNEQVEAAFFCIGEKISGQEGILKRMVSEGHIIGNHSFSHHRFFDFFSTGRMLDELERTRKRVLEICGLSPRFFRPPYGVTNPHLRKAVFRGGYISIGWSVRSMDTVQRNEETLIKKIITSIKPGAIVLLHDRLEITRAVLPELIRQIRQQGFRIVRLDKMINLNPYD